MPDGRVAPLLRRGQNGRETSCTKLFAWLSFELTIHFVFKDGNQVFLCSHQSWVEDLGVKEPGEGSSKLFFGIVFVSNWVRGHLSNIIKESR
jgi:hypothetical protein